MTLNGREDSSRRNRPETGPLMRRPQAMERGKLAAGFAFCVEPRGCKARAPTPPMMITSEKEEAEQDTQSWVWVFSRYRVGFQVSPKQIRQQSSAKLR